MDATCPNCSAHLAPDFQYCPRCGQPQPTHRLTLPHIGHEVVHALTHADKGVFHLLLALIRRPGTVAREYVVEGKRKRYFNPFTLLMLVLGIAVFVNTTLLHDTPASHQRTETVATASLTRAEARKARQGQVNAFFSKKANIVAFLALPLVALIFSLFFRRTGLGYAEHLVANVLFAGCYLLITDLILVPGLRLLHVNPQMVGLVIVCFHITYLTIAYAQFLGGHYRWGRLRSLLASTAALLAWSVVSFTAAFVYIALG